MSEYFVPNWKEWIRYEKFFVTFVFNFIKSKLWRFDANEERPFYPDKNNPWMSSRDADVWSSKAPQELELFKFILYHHIFQSWLDLVSERAEICYFVIYCLWQQVKTTFHLINFAQSCMFHFLKVFLMSQGIYIMLTLSHKSHQQQD